MTGRRWILFLFYLGLSALLAQFHGYVVNFGPKQGKRLARHEQILQREGEAPWAYRLVMPALAESVASVPAAMGWPRRDAIEVGYLFWRWLFTFGLFLLFHRFLSAWLDPPWALAGTLLLAALHGPSYAWYWFQPASSLDFLLWMAAATLTTRGRYRWLFPLLVLGALNRETAVFMVVIHGALRLGREPLRPLLLRCVALFACWAVTYGALLFLVAVPGWAHGGNPLGMLVANIRHPGWLLYAASFFGVLWLAPLGSWSHQPPALRYLLLGLLPYLALQLLFGRIREVRLLLPLAMVLIPMGLLEWQRRTAGGGGA